VANTARLPRGAIVDKAGFSVDMLSTEMSGKYSALVKRIKNLDGLDMRDHGRKFKHFIFTDLRDGAFGGKAIAAFLIRGGFEFALDSKGLKAGGAGGTDRFAVLQSQPLWGKPLTVGLKKTVLETYNKRPENIHGELLRILVLDSKFKEGIDLFDVKYCHIMEEPLASSDMKQAVGRATRFCGQKGLPFVDGVGWTLNVFVYRTVIPGVAPFIVMGEEAQSIDAHTLVMKYSGLDLSLLVLTKEITELAIRSAVDRPLTREINPQRHRSQIGGSFLDKFGRYAWPVQTLRNACEVGAVAPGTAVRFTPTQQFVRHYLTPDSPTKGLLAWHSVGTGKTCTAVATASGAFLAAGYRILWVTRNSLMSDVWKNVFDSVCYMPFRRLGLENRGVIGKLGKGDVSPLFMKPISYKMFQNALERKNDLGRMLYRANGEDMLRRTFLIIDEVHKLHDGDLLATEKADFNVIQSFIWQSYRVSGADSVRPLLMSATPIGDTPASLFDILNTLIPDPGEGLMALEHFRREFTDKEGHVLAEGAHYFMEQSKGLISYLNREQDPTTFAIPTIRTITVGLGDMDIPDVRMVARRCLPLIEAAGSKTRKKARRGCYLAVKSEFTQKYKGTQRNQLAECFGAKAAKPDFPNYAEFVGEVGGLGNTESVESEMTTDAVINK
jgi:hypothetical protein